LATQCLREVMLTFSASRVSFLAGAQQIFVVPCPFILHWRL